MSSEQSEAEKAAEEWTETREGLVELPYSRKTICTAMVKEQIAAFLAGAAWAAPKWVNEKGGLENGSDSVQDTKEN